MRVGGRLVEHQVPNAFHPNPVIKVIAFGVEQKVCVPVKEHVPSSGHFCVLKPRNLSLLQFQHRSVTFEYSHICTKFRSSRLK